jgi:hypothetical protein
VWPIFGVNGVLFYLLWWSSFEVIYRLRKRDALVCRNCGFDPFLYKQDRKKARSAVQKYWRDRIENEELFRGLKLKNYQTKPANEPVVETVAGLPDAARQKNDQAQGGMSP